MTVWELEQAIYDKEEVRVVIRAPWRTAVGDYEYQRAAAGSSTITEWLQQRVQPLLRGGEELVVVDGNGGLPHGRTKMSTLRATYER